MAEKRRAWVDESKCKREKESAELGGKCLCATEGKLKSNFFSGTIPYGKDEGGK
jgi:hypothetical protein